MMTERKIQNIKTYHKGQVIFQEGQQGTYAYMIKKGSVTLYRTVDNRKVVLDRLGKGEIFGEMGALAEQARSASAEAAEYCELMVLTRQQVTGMLERSPKTVKHLVNLLLKRLRKANSAGGARTGTDTFLAICRILEMSWATHSNLPPAQAKRIPNHTMGLPVRELARTCKTVLLTTEAELQQVLEKLRTLKIIEINATGTGKAFADRYVRITSPETFLEVAGNLAKQLGPEAACSDLEFMDIFDFAEAVNASPEVIYKKMAAGEIPESLFLFHKANTMAWAEQQEEGFFRKVKRKRKKIEDLEDVNDIVFVDNATLKDVFAKLGYYKLGILMSVAEEDARKKIVSNLARKIAAIVQEEAENRENVDEAEAQDVQDELVSLVKAAKGVSQ